MRYVHSARNEVSKRIDDLRRAELDTIASLAKLGSAIL